MKVGILMDINYALNLLNRAIIELLLLVFAFIGTPILVMKIYKIFNGDGE